MREEEEKIDYELLARILEGNYSEDDSIKFREWKNKSEENENKFKEFEKLYHYNDFVVPQSGFDTERAYAKVVRRIEDNDKGRRINPFIYYGIAVAASITLLMLWFLNPNTTILYETTSKIEEFYLPDSTRVVLAKDSRLELDKGFGTSNRLSSINGKVYFDVIKNKDLPFIIKTHNSNIEVIGTAFLVETFGKSSVVSVERGKVRHSSTIDKDISENLTKRQTSIINDKGILVNRLESLNFMFWATKKLSYSRETLDNIFQELEKIFEVKFKYDKSQARNCRMSGLFINQNLSQLLDNMALSVDFSFEITGDQVTITQINCGDIQ